jgi:hypothetical protein
MRKHWGCSTSPAKSVAVTTNVTARPAALVASAMTFAGTVTIGRSVTLTVNVFVALWLPWASVAWHETVVDPSGKVEPDVRAHAAGMLPSRCQRAPYRG